jgi:hypothetical protein
MWGILRLAYQLLVNDRAKFAALLVGITFAVFLMIQMTSLFAGVLDKSSSTVTNIGAKVWVMEDKEFKRPNCSTPLRIKQRSLGAISDVIANQAVF